MGGRGSAAIGAGAAILALAAAFAAGATQAQAADPVRQGPSPRIIDGTWAPPGSWPSIVRLDVGCGGTLVAPRWVLTAGHCWGAREVILGRHDLYKKGEGEVIRVVRRIKHPRYNRGFGGVPNDFRLLKLARPSKQPVMPTSRKGMDPEAGDRVYAAGWGATRQNGSGGGTHLRQVEMRIVGSRACKREHGSGYHRPRMICAQGEPRPGDPIVGDTCPGDSGGPLVAEGPDGPYLVGITSFGPSPCGTPRSPGVYARVSGVTGWIDSWVGPKPQRTLPG